MGTSAERDVEILKCAQPLSWSAGNCIVEYTLEIEHMKREALRPLCWYQQANGCRDCWSRVSSDGGSECAVSYPCAQSHQRPWSGGLSCPDERDS